MVMNLPVTWSWLNMNFRTLVSQSISSCYNGILANRHFPLDQRGLKKMVKEHGAANTCPVSSEGLLLFQFMAKKKMQKGNQCVCKKIHVKSWMQGSGLNL